MSKVNGPPLARRGIWAYPWDLVDRAAGDPLGGILAAGLESVSIATIYHPVQALLPANPRRIWFADDAGAYYTPDPSRYGLLAPRPADLPRDLLEELFSETRASGLRAIAWLAMTHSTLAAVNPALAVRSVDGTRHATALCPAQPEVQSYVVRAAREVSERFGPDTLELEAIGWPGLPHHEHLHLGTAIDGPARFLASICFCNACLVLGADTIRDRVAGLLRRELAEPQVGRSLGALLEAEPAIAGFQAIREGITTELVASIRDSVEPRLRLTVDDDPRIGGLALGALGTLVDEVAVCAYTADEASLRAIVESTLADVAPDRVIVGLSICDPEMPDRDTLARAVATVRDLRLAGVCFYNHSLVGPERMSWVASSLAGANGEAAAVEGSWTSTPD